MLGIGELLWDVFDEGKQLGGALGNVIYHCSQLGLASTLLSALGEDDLGREAEKLLRNRGLDATALQWNSFPTGLVRIVRDEAGDATYEIVENVAWDHIAKPHGWDTDFAPGAIVFGTLAQRSKTSRLTIRELISHVPENTVRFFDVNLRPPFVDLDVIRWSIEHASIVKMNSDEVSTVASAIGVTSEIEKFASELLAKPLLELVAITGGAGPSHLFSRNEHSVRTPRKTNVVDTVGAGDSFSAALIFGQLRSMSLIDMHDLANRLAAMTCAAAGAMPEYPPSFRVRETNSQLK